jgi:hypothetical protein
MNECIIYIFKDVIFCFCKLSLLPVFALSFLALAKSGRWGLWGGRHGDQMSFVKKIASSETQPVLCQNKHVIFRVAKSSPRICATSVLKKISPTKQSPNARKFVQSGHPGGRWRGGEDFFELSEKTGRSLSSIHKMKRWERLTKGSKK